MVTVGDSVAIQDIRIVQGDVFSISLARADANGIIDTAGWAARMMIRNKKTLALIATLATTPTAGQGTITVGIVGSAPTPPAADTRTNVTLFMDAVLTAALPRVKSEDVAEWVYDLEMISDPLAPEDSTNKWIRGAVYLTNEYTFDEVGP